MKQQTLTADKQQTLTADKHKLRLTVVVTAPKYVPTMIEEDAKHEGVSQALGMARGAIEAAKVRGL